MRAPHRQAALAVAITGMLALLVDPLLNSLRDDPRYKALIAKMNFPST